MPNGKLAVVTGATGGLGYETALALARHGWEVILAGRNDAKGREAIQRIQNNVPQAPGRQASQVRFERVDLADLTSVAAFASRLVDEDRPLDLLINNAGVMALPTREVTVDGFERQLGTNYLSHFALTARLLPLLRRSPEPRVVQVSSGAHRMGGAIHLNDLQWERSYQAWPAYGQSKLAMLMFALELQRRSDENGWGLMSNAAHPGYARTELITNGPGDRSFFARVSGLLRPFLSQSAAEGARPTVFAAIDPEAKGGAYYGPVGPLEMKGPVGVARIGRHARDLTVARRLWEVSEELTGVRWLAAATPVHA